MKYSDAEKIMAKNIDVLRTKLFFQLNGMQCQFLGLIIAPENSALEFKQMMYEECIKKGTMDLFILRDKGLMDEEMKVFMIYSQGGREIIIPFEDRLQALIKYS
jgi:hypothetical protein